MRFFFTPPFLFLCFFISSCSLFETQKETQRDEVEDAFGGVAYDVEFDSSIPAHILNIVKKASILLRLQKNPPLTLTALEKRAIKDMFEMEEALGIDGYFDGKVTFVLEDKTTPPILLIQVQEGELYHIKSLNIEYEDGEPFTSLGKKLDLATLDLPLHPKDPVNLEKAQNIAKSIAKYYRGHGFPFARALTLKGTIDRDTKVLDLVFYVHLGPKATFGKVTIQGAKDVNHTYIHNRLDWKEGKVFDERKLDDARKELVESGLFNDVRIQADSEFEKSPHSNTSSSDLTSSQKTSTSKTMSVPIDVTLKEGPPRSFGGGVKYGTSDGWSGKLFWRHDNALGGGQGFESKLEIGRRKNEIRLTYSIPDFLKKDQTLVTSVAGVERKTRAFTSKTMEMSGILNNTLSKKWELGYGIEGETGTIKRNKIKNDVRLFSTPISLGFDNTKSLLNPTSGIRAKGKTSPYFGHFQKNHGFWVNEIFASTYLTPKTDTLETQENVHVVALWGKVGHITAKSIDVVPPTKRFYSGGGNSVRGYGYQLLGPLDSNRTPIGGRSVLEFGGEYRFPLNENFGLSTFLEAGSVGLTSAPKLRQRDLLWGAGMGIRYYTQIGPIRFDIAIPTKRRMDSDHRKKIDAPFQFYITMGQAF